MTVAAHKKVTFELTYEELLKRRLGKYELQIHARPMQPVKDFKVCLLLAPIPENNARVETSDLWSERIIIFISFLMPG